jgi:hypothetical protein
MSSAHFTSFAQPEPESFPSASTARQPWLFSFS